MLIQAAGSPLLFRNASELDFGNIPVKNWAGPQGGGGNDGFPTNGSGSAYLVDKNLLLDEGKNVICDMVECNDVVSDNITAALTLGGHTVNAGSYYIFDSDAGQFVQALAHNTDDPDCLQVGLDSIRASEVKTDRITSYA